MVIHINQITEFRLMETFFTADTHFGHKNICNFAERPFGDVQQMDEHLVLRWNECVKQGDRVFHLGDFSYYPREKTERLLNRLNGNIFLVRGNHDKVIKGSITDKFGWVKDYYELKEVAVGESKKIVLCHYAFKVWNKSHYGSWHLHGHSHGSLDDDGLGKIMDVGIDNHPDYAPFHLDEVSEFMSEREYHAFDHHDRRRPIVG